MRLGVTKSFLLSIVASSLCLGLRDMSSEEADQEIPWWKTFRQKFLKINNTNPRPDKIHKLGFSRPVIDIEALKEKYSNLDTVDKSDSLNAVNTKAVTNKKKLYWRPLSTPNQRTREREKSISPTRSKSDVMMGNVKLFKKSSDFVRGSLDTVWGGVSNHPQTINQRTEFSNSYFLPSPFLQQTSQSNQNIKDRIKKKNRRKLKIFLNQLLSDHSLIKNDKR